MKGKRIALFMPTIIVLPLGWYGWNGGIERMARLAKPVAAGPAVPSTTVKRGDVVFNVTARGEVAGGNSEMLVAPMTGGGEMAITALRAPGEVVKPGDVVVQFDTTEQEFRLKEAEADLAEAEQQVIRANAESAGLEEETSYQLIQARAQLRIAQLEQRRNPLLAAIAAKQNNLAVEAAADRLRQLESDVASSKKTSQAGIAIQEAARNKAKVKADMARKNIESMTLRAKSGGYVAIQANMNSNWMYWGMQLPMLQLGDTVRAGMAVAQIPDLSNWEATARIGELDRGHLSIGQKADIEVVALPGKKFTGKIKEIGGTTGPPWDRHFDCKITLESPSPEMRPGMTANIVITTEILPHSLWVPAQAVFESDGRTYVYARTAAGFTPRDVKLVRRSESQVVVSGVNEGQVIALANPDQQTKKQQAGGAMSALPK